MRLTQYIKALQEIENKYGDLMVIYSIDDEGNDFKMVNYDPTPGNFEDDDFNSELVGSFNAVCIN